MMEVVLFIFFIKLLIAKTRSADVNPALAAVLDLIGLIKIIFSFFIYELCAGNRSLT